MKIKVIAGLSLVFFTMTLFYIAGIAKGDTVLPDKSNIQAQIHLNKIQELVKTTNDDNKKQSLINDYLAKLNAKELLETAAEISNAADTNKQITSEDLSIVVPHLAKAWRQGIPNEKVVNILKDKTYNKTFRMFIIDAATNLNGEEGQNNTDVIDSIYSIAKDSNEDAGLRRYAILSLTKPGVYKPLNDTTGKSQLYNIYMDQNSPIEVKGAVITAMRRTQDPQFEETVIPILRNLTSYPSIVIRHAVIEAATSRISADYIKQLSDLASSTTDKDVYASTILALGINGGTEAIKAIILDYGRFNNPDICNYSLERNHKTIVTMLNLNQPSDFILAGISAANLTKIDSYITPLKQIKENSKDHFLSSKSDQTLKNIESNSIPSNPKLEEASK